MTADLKFVDTNVLVYLFDSDAPEKQMRARELLRAEADNVVALIAADELAGWLETAHLLRSPKNARRLLAATGRAEAGEGEAVTVEELRQRLGLAGA